MELTIEQKQTVASWLAEGLSLSEVQKLLETEFNLKMTFMELRFLVDDLDLEVKDKPEKPDPDVSKAKPDAPQGAGEPGEPSLVDDGSPGGSGVRVEVDRVQRPGAMISGSALFSDGKRMGWQVDQLGRLGLIPGDDKDYRPSEADLAEFQQALQSELQKQGF